MPRWPEVASLCAANLRIRPSQPFGQHVEIARVTGRLSNSLELLVHPQGAAGGQQGLEYLHRRHGASRGNPQLVYILGFVRRVGGTGQIMADQVESCVERTAGDVLERLVGRSIGDPFACIHHRLDKLIAKSGWDAQNCSRQALLCLRRVRPSARGQVKGKKQTDKQKPSKTTDVIPHLAGTRREGNSLDPNQVFRWNIAGEEL